jgi:GntR family transcriptional regulator
MNIPISPSTVNRAALPLPLYEHVKRQISESILMGALAEGAVLPNETVLAAQYGVAGGTLRRALADLTTEGLLSRRRRTGTVVTGRTPHHSLRFFYHYFRLHSADGGLVHSDTRVTALEQAPATAEEAAALALEPGVTVIRVQRLRHVGGRAVMQEVVVLPASRVPAFPMAPEAVPQLLYQYLLDAYGLRISAVRESVTAGLATADERRALNLPRPAAVLRIASVSYDAAGQPVLMGQHGATTANHTYVNEVR